MYGEGGIMPDFFVPADTSAYNEFYTKVISKNVIYTSAFNYADQNRQILNKLGGAWDIEKYLIKNNVFQQLIKQIKSSGISYTPTEFKESGKLIEKQLYALIARNIIGDKGYYPIIFEIDKTVQKAVQLLGKNWSSNEIAQLNSQYQLTKK